ncbi:hypothetical protein GGR32_001900 [Mesonia hippocampi]|uniref:Phage tail protein n=1 Tax=Mesonia hippocampi TaxID=1628250 RepID=A0A840ENA2_9FLAO|nr:hypothetical protein [Mesonia hippocampi]MBB4119598.1 hypothetical protein [Mesonia hippocampi]
MENLKEKTNHVILKLQDKNGTEKAYKLDYVDYSISKNYPAINEEIGSTCINLSGVIKDEIDSFILEWAAQKDLDWKGELNVSFTDNGKTEIFIVNFKKSRFLGLSHGFSWDSINHNISVSAELMEVTINGVSF